MSIYYVCLSILDNVAKPGSSIKNNVVFIVYSLPNIGQSDMKTIEESKTLFLPSRHSKDSQHLHGKQFAKWSK